MAPIPVTILLGPTATGKSALGIKVARRIHAEIISADSMQVYRMLDIGTAKPSQEERALVPHHLIDICDPSETYSVAEFIDAADRAVADIHARGKKVLMVGGTALYIKRFIEGIFKGPPGDLEFRERLAEEARAKGIHALHARLQQVDPAAAERIHPNDFKRISRALEVFEKTGRPISSFQQQEGKQRPIYHFNLIGLRMPREVLYQRINRRVMEMIKSGLIEETQRVLNHMGGMGRGALQALGYSDVVRFLHGELTLEEAVMRIKKGTRRFAKRQLSWFRRFPNVEWVDLTGDEKAEELAEHLLPRFTV